MESTNTEVKKTDYFQDDKESIAEAHGQQDEKALDRGGDSALANAPLKYKLLALATALMLPLGSHFSGSALSAMKGTLIKELGIDNTRYGVISSSVSIINTIFPIAGGVFIDIFGSVWGSLAVNAAVLIGSLMTALAAQYSSFGLMVAGRVVFGIGSGLIVTMQETLLSKWFRTQHLSIAIGMQLSISRLATFIGTLASNPIAADTNNWVWPFWLSLIICFFSIAMNVIYALIVKRLQGTASALTSEEIHQLKRKKTFHFRSVPKFPVLFWLIILIQFVYAAVWSSFQTISTDLIKVHFGTTQVLAGYQASASQVVPIVAAPLLGFIMDYFGYRIVVLLLSSVFLILSSGLLGWTYVNAVVGMVFYSISLAFGPIAMITSIGMILPSKYIGTGLGIYKSSNNIGTSILDIVVGVVQDHTANNSYTQVMLVFIILAGIGLVLICGLWIAQRYKLDNLLELGRVKRLQRMQEFHNRELDYQAQGIDMLDLKKTRYYHYIIVGFFAAALIVAWVLFFVYAASGDYSL